VAVGLDTLMTGELRRTDTLIQSSTLQRRRVSAVNLTQNHQFSVSQLGVVEFVDQYTEKYLVAHAIFEGRFHTSIVCLFVCLCLSVSHFLCLHRL